MLITASANGHGFLNGTTPFTMKGRTAWWVLGLSSVDWHTFMVDTINKHHNAIEIGFIWRHDFSNSAPFGGNGAAPFLKRLDGANWNGSINYSNINTQAPDFSTPNSTYWSFVDDFVSYCDSHNILILGFPSYVGIPGSTEGWLAEMVANGATKMTTYGAFIADRYKSFGNIMWMAGGDGGNLGNPFSSQETAVEQAMLNGMASISGQTSTLMSAEWRRGSTAKDQTDFGTLMTANSAYANSTDINNQCRTAYGSSAPILPAFLMEEPYDQEGTDGNSVNPDATQPVRRFQIWGAISSVGGYMSGNGFVWPFNTGVWDQHLNTQGAQDMSRFNSLIDTLSWYKLIPSGLNGMRTLVTSGGGTLSGDNYVSAACASDGTFMMAYVPPGHSGTITIDPRSLSRQYRARWWDPTTGSFTNIGAGTFTNSITASSQVFTPPGANSQGSFTDWLLLLDTPLSSATISWFRAT